MNKTELIKKLDDLDVPRFFYDLDGNLLPDRIILYNSYNDWIVFYLDERGNRHNQNTFDSEEKALNYIYKEFEKQYDYTSRDIYKILGNLRQRPHLDIAMKTRFFENMSAFLPPQFKDFFGRYNGLEGKIGTSTFIDIWKIEDIISVDQSSIKNKMNDDFVSFCDTNKETIFAFGKKDPGIFVLKSSEPGIKLPLFFADDYDNFYLELFDLDKKN